VLTRTGVFASSNAGAAVSLSAGTKDVYLTRPSDVESWYIKRRARRTHASAAELNGSFSAPITIIPVTLGYWPLLSYLTINKPANSVANVANGNTNLTLRIMKSNGTLLIVAQNLALAGFITGDTSAHYLIARHGSTFGAFDSSLPVDGYYDMKLDTANMVTGDATLEVVCYYDMIPSSLP
jgi:hypothetical protein